MLQYILWNRVTVLYAPVTYIKVVEETGVPRQKHRRPKHCDIYAIF